MGTKETLTEPSRAAMILGPLSLGLALPLAVLIPVVLVLLGVGVYIIIQILPIIVMGTVFFIVYLICRAVKMREPWMYIIPLLMGFVSLIPLMIEPLRDSLLSAGGVNCQSGVAAQILDELFSVPKYLVYLMVGIFLLVGITSVQRLGGPGAFLGGVAALIVAFVIIGGEIDIFSTGGAAPMAGEAPLGIPPLLWIISLAGILPIVITWYGYRKRWW